MLNSAQTFAAQSTFGLTPVPVEDRYRVCGQHWAFGLFPNPDQAHCCALLVGRNVEMFFFLGLGSLFVSEKNDFFSTQITSNTQWIDQTCMWFKAVVLGMCFTPKESCASQNATTFQNGPPHFYMVFFSFAARS